MSNGASVLIASAPGNLLLPVLPLRDLCLFPEASLATTVNRPPIIAAVEVAGRSSRCLLAVAQRDTSVANPNPRDLHGVGTLAFVTED
ncbi:MAG TPA: LON peptidase substrate-binding domain-containing protein, partial [Vicinamibacteria bacterium]|nr:LON peptidase substrate-binding domain-containing protein [Vicinamibacteria bacterium]